MLPVSISVASENSVITLTPASDLAQLFLINYGNPNPPYAIIKDEPYHVSIRRSYYCRENDE